MILQIERILLKNTITIRNVKSNNKREISEDFNQNVSSNEESVLYLDLHSNSTRSENIHYDHESYNFQIDSNNIKEHLNETVF